MKTMLANLTGLVRFPAFDSLPYLERLKNVMQFHCS